MSTAAPQAGSPTATVTTVTAAAVTSAAHVTDINTSKASKLPSSEKETNTKKSGRNVVSIESLPSTALRCVSLSFLVRFTDHHQLWHRKTKDVVRDIIVPLSESEQCVWSDLEPATSLLHPEEDIGPPQIFVSHAWTNTWGLLVLALVSYAEFHGVSPVKLKCWIDIFVINQHNYMQELAQLDAVIAVCGNFIQIVDSENAVPLKRVWCLYEVMARIKHKKGGKITVTVASITPPLPAATSTSSASPSPGSSDVTSSEGTPPTPAAPELILAPQKRIDELLRHVDMQRAEASYPADVEKIFRLVRTEVPGGFKTVNAEVQQALVQNSILNTFKQAAAAAAGPSAGKKQGGRGGGAARGKGRGGGKGKASAGG